MDDWTQIDPDLILVSDLIAEATPGRERPAPPRVRADAGAHTKLNARRGVPRSGRRPITATVRTLQQPTG